MISEPNGDSLGETKEFKTLSPGTLISHFRVVEKIGAGGMGVVYKAEDTRLKRTVALKFLPPQLTCDAGARARFEHEAQSASALNHPNITTIHEIAESEGRCFIAMEYIEGKTVKDLIKEGKLSIDKVLDISLQIAEGLDAAHKKGVVHRDIKSDNIMVTSEGKVKITDFGLAKLKGATKLTKSGTTVGTLHYMSPEQAQGEELDRRSDLFSFGVVFYEMVTGRLPFKGEYEQAIVYSILNDTPEPLARYKADVPDGFQRIARKVLEKDRQERYQHADGLAADLRHEKRIMGHEKTVEMPKTVVPKSRKKAYLRFLVPAAIVTVIVLLLFVFEPFRLELGPRKEAAARENSLAVMYFDNVLDPGDQDKIAHMITSLLITDLSESEYIQVRSHLRLPIRPV
jgi:serine/threonine protein kinase